MNKTKKTLCAVLVLLLTFTATVPAFAAVGTTGTIVINDAEEDYTYRYSKIFDYSVDGTSGAAITLASPAWAQALQSAGMEKYVTVTPETTESGTVYNVTFNAALDTDGVLASAFAQNALRNSEEVSEQPTWTNMTTTGTTATATGLSFGYYIVDTATVGIGDPAVPDSAVMVLLTRGGPTVTVTEKPDDPSIEKFVQTKTDLGYAIESGIAPEGDPSKPVTVNGHSAHLRRTTDEVITTPAEVMYSAYLLSCVVPEDYGGVLVDPTLGLQYDYLPENPNSSFGSKANWQSGDTVWYMLRLRVPSAYVKNLTITDTLGAGLAYQNVSGIKFGSSQYTQNGINTGGFNANRGASVPDKPNTYIIDGMGPIAAEEYGLGGMTVDVTNNADDTTTVSIRLNDKAVQEIANNEKYVYFWYKAKITDKAVESDVAATTNTVTLSWDGKDESEPDPTAKSVPVYTYDADVSKLDGRSENKKGLLPGAQFRLFYYKDGSTTPTYLMLAPKTDIAKSTEDGGRCGDTAAGYAVTGTTGSASNASTIIDMASNASLRIGGLRTGRTYYLEEVKAPTVGDVAYEKLQTPVEFELIPDVDARGEQFETAKLRINGHSGGTAQYAALNEGRTEWISGGLSVVNDVPLWALPTTGGSGTTALYVIGIALIGAAVAALIVRRRKAAAHAAE